jgi:hypothetical protein
VLKTNEAAGAFSNAADVDLVVVFVVVVVIVVVSVAEQRRSAATHRGRRSQR